MQSGIFMMPSHPPERSLRDGFQWDLEHLALCDRLGFDEAWLGEHFTSPWEPNPAPDLLIAQALLRTQTMKLAPGAHLLPYHHPAELACRVAYLDHIVLLAMDQQHGRANPIGKVARRNGVERSAVGAGIAD